MRFEKVSSDITNKLFRDTKLQTMLNEFARMEDTVVKCVLEPGEYSSIKSAQSSYYTAIKRSGHRTDPDYLERLYGGFVPAEKGRIINSEFLALLAERVRMKIGAYNAPMA